MNPIQGADLTQHGKYRGLTRLEAALMRKFSHKDRIKEILDNRGRSPPPDFADIQKVFYELHQTNEFQDREFVQLLFPTVQPIKLTDPQNDPLL